MIRVWFFLLLTFSAFPMSACEESNMQFKGHVLDAALHRVKNSDCTDVRILFGSKYTDKSMYLGSVRININDSSGVKLANIPVNIAYDNDAYRMANFCVSDSAYEHAVIELYFFYKGIVELDENGLTKVGSMACFEHESYGLKEFVELVTKKVKVE